VIRDLAAIAERQGASAQFGGEQTPWAKTVRTCQLLLKVADGLWTFLEIEGIEPTNNAAVDEVFSAGVHALRQSVI
jgi:hypothetical protein